VKVPRLFAPASCRPVHGSGNDAAAIASTRTLSSRRRFSLPIARCESDCGARPPGSNQIVSKVGQDDADDPGRNAFGLEPERQPDEGHVERSVQARLTTSSLASVGAETTADEQVPHLPRRTRTARQLSSDLRRLRNRQPLPRASHRSRFSPRQRGFIRRQNLCQSI
jgi:hypothetical protein